MKPRLTIILSLIVLAATLGVAEAVPVRPAPHRDGSSTRHDRARRARGQEQEEPAPQRRRERVVVTANRLSEAVGDVGSAVTVITAEEIDAAGARWLADVLETVPGVTVARNGGPGMATSVFLRGTNPNHTLFLINGVEVNSPSTGSYDLAHLPADQIERIEIVRGPQSTLYGSEALGGVVNVITRSGSGPISGGLEIDGGSFATGAVRGWLQGEAEGWRYSGDLAFTDTDGISAAAAERGNVEEDPYTNLSVDGRVGWRSRGGWSFEGFVRAFDAEIAIDDFAFGVGPVDDDNFVSDAREVYAAGTVRYETPSWSTAVTVSDSEIDLTTSNPDGAFFTGFLLDAAIRELDWQSQLSVGREHLLIAGVELQRERGEVVSETLFGTSGFAEEVDVVGIYALDRIEIGDRVDLSVGGRFEDHSTYGGKATFRATGSVLVAESARWHGSVGSGFRAPSLNDLFFPGFGNRDLEPEESLGIDTGIELVFDEPRVGVDLTWFWNDIDNLVDFGPTGPLNLGEVRTTGLEVAGDWSPVAGVRVSAAYTWTDAEDRGTDLQLVRRPRHQGSVRLDWTPLERFDLFGEIRAEGERRDNGPLGPVLIEGFGLVNLAGRLRLSPTVRVDARVDNLLDADYQEVFGFGTPGRSGYVGLSLRWSAGE